MRCTEGVDHGLELLDGDVAFAGAEGAAAAVDAEEHIGRRISQWGETW